MCMVRMLDRAHGNASLGEFLDQVDNELRFPVVFSTNNVQSFHNANHSQSVEQKAEC